MLGFDIETTGLMSDEGARISVLCTVDSETGQETSYNLLAAADDAVEYARLRARILSAFDMAQQLCAYNAVLFDIPFMAKELRIPADTVHAWLFKLADPFHTIKTCFKTTCKLDRMLMLNGLECKSASGLEAIVMAKNRQWPELIEYCMQDVRLTVQLCQQQRVLLFKHMDGFHVGCSYAAAVPAGLSFWATQH